MASFMGKLVICKWWRKHMDRYPRSVQVFASDTDGKYIGTSNNKPLALIEYMIRTYTNEGDLILDTTCGSGTTGLGAKNLK